MPKSDFKTTKSFLFLLYFGGNQEKFKIEVLCHYFSEGFHNTWLQSGRFSTYKDLKVNILDDPYNKKFFNEIPTQK